MRLAEAATTAARCRHYKKAQQLLYHRDRETIKEEKVGSYQRDNHNGKVCKYRVSRG
jgi:hypothetical protein